MSGSVACWIWHPQLRINFPITALLDERIFSLWLERYLHPNGVNYPYCASIERRAIPRAMDFPAYRCRTCLGYYTLLAGTVFEKTRQQPATLASLLRGIAKGESTACLTRDLGLSRNQLNTLRQRSQANLDGTVPTGLIAGMAFEVDDLYQNAGEKRDTPS